MTESGSVLLDRAQIERALTALGDRLVRRGVVLGYWLSAARVPAEVITTETFTQLNGYICQCGHSPLCKRLPHKWPAM